MAATGYDLLMGLLAVITSMSLFAAAAYSQVLKNMVPKGQFAVIFPYLSAGSFFLGFMMIVYFVIFFSGRSEQSYYMSMTSFLFFLGAIFFMVGAYKVSQTFAIQRSPKHRTGPTKNVKAKSRNGSKVGRKNARKRRGSKKKKKGPIHGKGPSRIDEEE